MSSSIHQTFLDGDDINLLSRVLKSAGYDEAAAPELFAQAASKALALFRRGMRREEALLTAIRIMQDRQQILRQTGNTEFESRFAIQGLPPSSIIIDEAGASIIIDATEESAARK
jgi:hypothetical protein